MPERFDPYAQWLGLRDGRPVSYYRLLGVADFEGDSQTIALAAERALARVRSFRPGPHAAEWQRLLDELSAAKRCLTDTAQRSQYDDQLRRVDTGDAESATAHRSRGEPSDANRLPPAHRPGDEAAATWPAEDPMSPVPFVASDRPQLPSQAGDMATSLESSAAARGGTPRVQSDLTFQPVARAVIAVPVGRQNSPSAAGASGAASHGSQAVAPAANPTVSRVAHPQGQKLDDGAKSGRDSPLPAASRRVLILSCVAAVMVVVAGGIAMVMHAQRGGTESAALTTPDAKHNSQPGGPPAVAAPGAIPVVSEQTSAQATALPPRVQPAQGEVSPKSQSDSPLSVQTQEKPAAPADSTPTDPQQAAAFDKGLQDIRAALAARKLETARQQLEALSNMPVSAEQAGRLKRVHLLHKYVASFWRAVGDSLKRLQPADELPVNNTIVIVVEVTPPDAITIRMEGTVRAYTVPTMASGLARALAEHWFDQANPSSKLSLGAFQAVDPNGDLTEARRLWEEASAGGNSAAELMPLLDEPRPAAVFEKGPLPDPQLLAQAARAIHARFHADFKAARSAETKLTLANTLLSEAAKTDDVVQRFALGREARDLAVAGGDLSLAVKTIDELQGSFKLDAWSMKAEVLKKAAATGSADVAKAAAKLALELADKANGERNFAAAESLCRAAESAARKSRDAELVKQSIERRKKAVTQLKTPPGDG